MDPRRALEWLLANSYKDGDIVKIPAEVFYSTIKAGLTESEQDQAGKGYAEYFHGITPKDDPE